MRIIQSKKVLIITNIILLICLTMSIIYIFKDSIFQNEPVEEFVILSSEEFLGRSGFRSETFQLDHDEDYIRNNIAIDEKKAVEIFKMLVVDRLSSHMLFVLPYRIKYDERYDTYVINAFLKPKNYDPNIVYEKVYRFEISRRDGAVIDSHISG